MSVKCILTGQTPDINDIGAQPKITTDGILKGDGNGNITTAVAGIDYLKTAPVTSVNGKTGAVTIEVPTVPTALKNPNALTIKTSSDTVSYDGSVAKTVEITDAGDLVTKTTEVLPAYTNQISLSTDAAGAVLNGVGYESGQLDMSGTVTTGTLFVSGFIPVKKGDVIRVKDPSSVNFSTGLVFALYKADKATGTNIGRYINTMQASASYGAVSISGNILTWDTSSVGYYFWTDFAYLRVTTNSAASIVTVNEEIVETSQTVMTLKHTVKVDKESLNFSVGTSLLDGKKVVVFGDSIIGMTRDQTSVPAYAAAYTGAEVYNVGFGGCRMSVHPSNGYAAFSMWALADAVATGDYTTQDAQAPNGSDYFPEQVALLKSINFNDIDMIVIHYGTNDFAGNVVIDNASDDDDTTTLCGALRYSLRKLQTAYPKIHIFISAPIYRMWDSTGAEDYTNSNGKKLRDFCMALMEVASDFNCPIIDGYKALGINNINDSAFSTNGTHLNDYGRKVLGEYIGGNLISASANESNITQTVLDKKQNKITANGLLKGNGTGNITAAEEAEVELVEITPALIGAAVKSKVLNITLPTASWTGSGPYTQTVTISGGTANTKADLQGDSAVIAQMISDGCNGLYISNTDGVFTAYAINNKPTVNLTVQVTLSEVTS